MRLMNRKGSGGAKIVAAAVLMCGLAACRTTEPARHVESVIAIQNHPVEIDCKHRDGLFFFLNLHENERTSVEAASDVHSETGGTICRLVHGGGRNISFSTSEGRLAFDPNRIFTSVGAEATLRSLSPDSAAVTPEAVESVRRFARTVVDTLRLENRPLIVALHNNTEGNYSTLSYQPGGVYETEAEAVHLEPGADPDDFFFVTERDLFEKLRAEGFNVVLQHNEAMTDDGSLSVYAAQHGLRYVNVEAQHGHRKEQARMIRALYRVLRSAELR